VTWCLGFVHFTYKRFWKGLWESSRSKEWKALSYSTREMVATVYQLVVRACWVKLSWWGIDCMLVSRHVFALIKIWKWGGGGKGANFFWLFWWGGIGCSLFISIFFVFNKVWKGGGGGSGQSLFCMFCWMSKRTSMATCKAFIAV